MPRESYSCKLLICHRCHKGGRDKSWVNLNGVLNGDILPSVATGLSFTELGYRPLVDASMVERMGRCNVRPLPLLAESESDTSGGIYSIEEQT